VDPHAGHVFGHTVFAITAVLTPEAEPIATSADTPEVQPASLAVTLTAAGLAVAGVASMIYEVAWTRALSLVIGSSTYAFTAMLLAFLLGLALGSALFSRVFGASASPTSS
jgi:spermidine synthase